MTLDRRTLLVAGLAAATLPLAARAATPPVFTRDGAAISGTDPVAYFTEGGPVAGDPAITADWQGATWRFASGANRDRFLSDPPRWSPAYGGWCAWAVSRGYTAKTEPEAWNIHEGRLFLNFDLALRRRFLRNLDANIARADANWPAVLNA